MKIRGAGFLLAASLCALTTGAQSNETTTYTYDELGRLIGTSKAGNVNAGISTSVGYDPAGNRLLYTLTGANSGGFEYPEVGSSYVYLPTTGPAAFTGNTGIAGNNSAWGFVAAPEGDQVAFLQGAGTPSTIKLTISGLTPGSNYAVTFHMAMRPGYAANPISLDFAGVALGTFTPTSNAFTLMTSPSFTAGAASGIVTFTATDPSVYLATGLDNVTVAPAAAASPAFSVSDASVTEGGGLAFTVAKSGSTGSSFTVAYATADGTAGATDYTGTGGTLTFAAGESSKTVSVATTGDTLDESNETLSLNLSNASGGASISDPQGIGTIVDDDDPPATPPPPPVFAITGASANEGSSLLFTITKSGTATASHSVSYATSNGSATAYSDYYPANGTLTFTAGQTSQTVSVATVNDSNTEPAETVLMTLSAPTGGATLDGQQSQATGTIAASIANSPPTAVLDTVSIARCTAGSFNVVANDTDPEGDLPLILTGVGGAPLQLGYVSVGSNTDVAWAKASMTGLHIVSYTVKDSRNASSTGSLRVTVTGTGSDPCP